MAIATTNPATGEILKTFDPLTAEQIAAKLSLAVKTFAKFRDLTFAERGAMMCKAADILEAEKEDAARLMTLEMGKPIEAAPAKAVDALELADAAVSFRSRRRVRRGVFRRALDWISVVQAPAGRRTQGSDHLGFRHCAQSFVNIFGFHLLSFCGLSRTVRSMADGALIQIEVLCVRLSPAGDAAR